MCATPPKPLVGYFSETLATADYDPETQKTEEPIAGLTYKYGSDAQKKDKKRNDKKHTTLTGPGKQRC